MRVDLSGRWSFDIDPEKLGIDQGFFQLPLLEEIMLPGTIASNRIGEPKEERAEGHLTDPYAYEGYAWFARYLNFDLFETHEYKLVLERTRFAHVWLDNTYVDSRDSLISSQEFDLSPYVTKKKHRITICVDNSSYPIPGGHMTSKDTQTNWNGITGAIYLEARLPVHLLNIRIDASYEDRRLDLECILHGAREKTVRATILDGDETVLSTNLALVGGSNRNLIDLPRDIVGWSEFTPKLYTLVLDLDGEETRYSFGVRDFKAVGRHFEINGIRTFLRGKHDGLIFPETGYAPTDVDTWLRIMQTAKDYGINHYRFHTACPPDAAFTAADRLGIYMEPELPFWGTVTTEADDEHDVSAQAYLISEGFRMLDEFGNHPSFVMMSLGNELWGSQERINEILATYRHYDSRPLYTQGSNNFQFVPTILSNEDFFVGVRFSKNRLFRGSYAMCDAPQGHIQTEKPNSSHNYDQMIVPAHVQHNQTNDREQEILIQHGTEMKAVTAEEHAELVPEIPVISHEIGQYAMYPDFREIEKYTGVLKAYNLLIFRERLEAKGMLHLADAFFQASGRHAVNLYKAELEAAIRSEHLAGYQILDLQDFSGQGTALVGVLDAFMESKGLIEPQDWRSFSDRIVLMAEIDDFVREAGSMLDLNLKLAHYDRRALIEPSIHIELREGTQVLQSVRVRSLSTCHGGVFDLGRSSLILPEVTEPTVLELHLSLTGSEVSNRYTLYVYPKQEARDAACLETADYAEVRRALMDGRSVVYFKTDLDEHNSVEGTYCTDFWCYPMFRRISESMERPLPVGTHGFLIEEEHPLFSKFATSYYSTPQWYDIASNSRSQILDGLAISPIVSTIDNFERNHKLGTIWEAKVGDGRLFVVTAALPELVDSLPATSLLDSVRAYVASDAFLPEASLEIEELDRLMGGARDAAN